jgi:4-amino-4-deoxy-L-arabinose transferase-like glycosyltransferase
VAPLLWLITALWGSLLLGASVLWPMSYGYDEAQHVDMAYVYSAHPLHFYGPDGLSLTKSDVALQHLLPGIPPVKRLADAPIAPRGQRPTLAGLGGSTAARDFFPNQMVQHPPLYYELEALVLRVPGVSHQAWDLQLWLMRLVSLMLLLPLPVLCWATARRLVGAWHVAAGASPDTTSRLAVLAAVVPLTVPNLVRVGSSVNNDALLILTTSVLLYLVARVLTGDLSRRTAVGVGASLAAALLTKGFALVLPPVVLAAYVVGGRQVGGRSALRRPILAPLAIAAAGGVVGGLWWLRNLVDYGTVQTSGIGAAYQRLVYGPPDNHGTLTKFAPLFISDFARRIWGGVGLPDFPSPGRFVIDGWLLVVLLGMVAALVVPAGPGSRLRAGVLVSAPVFTVLVVAQGSWSSFEHWSTVTHGAQGRYLYPTIVVLAGLATIGWLRILPPRARSKLIPATLVGAVVTNGWVWLLVLHSWYESLARQSHLTRARGAVAALLRWSPLPSAVTVLLVGVLPAALSVAAVVAGIRYARPRSPRDARVAPRDSGRAGKDDIASDEDDPRGDDHGQRRSPGEDGAEHEREHDVADAGSRRGREEQHAE